MRDLYGRLLRVGTPIARTERRNGAQVQVQVNNTATTMVSRFVTAGPWLAALLLLAAACEVRDAQEPPRFWTLYSMAGALDSGEPVARGKSLPAGLPASSFLTRREDGNLVPRVL